MSNLRWNSVPVFVILIFIQALFSSLQTVQASVLAPVTTKCKFYNNSCVTGDCPDESECNVPDSNKHDDSTKRNHCFVLWSIGQNGAANVSLKGCFLNTEDCYGQNQCVDRSSNGSKALFFCCCEGDLCNEDFLWEPVSTETPIVPSTATPIVEEFQIWYYLLGGFALLLLLFVIAMVFFWRHKSKHFNFNGLPTSEPHPMPPPSPILDTRPIQLVEVKARGRFGAVWKAQFKTEEIAVKIFPVQDKQSWQTEQEIFKLPYMSHQNILRFIGVEKRGDNLKAEFWLITAYHDKGSLCDYLKAHILTWTELCRIAETMARGLTHLHEAIPGKGPGQLAKPAIAHRDFKSKNVLLKDDMSACIADFGLAIIFEAGKSCGDTHGQVGTRRYMAPEVLEGAINFTPDAFLRIDMYACGLVLWELVSRCKAQDGPIPEYRLPFEEEVGPHPTLEDMQESVVQNKVRPAIQNHWRNHPGLSAMCDTMEECWDHDAEARLTASCVMERVIVQSQVQPPPVAWRIENDTPYTPLKDNSM